MRAEGVVLTTPEARAVLGAESMRAEGVVLTTPEARAVLGAESMRAEGVVLTTPEASLAAIERRVREVLAAVLQHPLEDRPYHAHVTVARPRRPWGREAVARFRSSCDDLAAEWEAARAVLMESQLGRDGARYSVCRDYVLDGATS
jgi:2'-5' RNA ligase